VNNVQIANLFFISCFTIAIVSPTMLVNNIIIFFSVLSYYIDDFEDFDDDDDDDFEE